MPLNLKITSWLIFELCIGKKIETLKNINQYVFDDKERKTKCQYMAPHFCICIVVAWPHNMPLDETNCIFLVLRHFQPSVGPKHWAIHPSIHPSTTPENNDRLRLMPVFFYRLIVESCPEIHHVLYIYNESSHLVWACMRSSYDILAVLELKLK